MVTAQCIMNLYNQKFILYGWLTPTGWNNDERFFHIFSRGHQRHYSTQQKDFHHTVSCWPRTQRKSNCRTPGSKSSWTLVHMPMFEPHLVYGSCALRIRWWLAPWGTVETRSRPVQRSSHSQWTQLQTELSPADKNLYCLIRTWCSQQLDWDVVFWLTHQ